jgi:hypothetical protein
LHHWLLALFVVIALALPVVLAGCSRHRYYCQADKDAKHLIAQKSCDPRWKAPPDFNIDMDPRSRYYDNCDQIFPPMPEDDPASDRYMKCIDGMKGYALWHAHGDRKRLDNPTWRERLGEVVELTKDGQIKLSLDSAVRLAYLNSPDYQNELETLYLSALDVSTERFRFTTQFYGDQGPETNNTSFTSTGPLNANGEASTLETDTRVTAQRLFATGGELVVGIANSIVWQFAGPETFSNISILNFNLVQPLLRGAGRAVALEQLTIVERALLANLRTLQSYRQGFFTEVAIGDGISSGLSRRGGFFGGTGLTGFTGTGIGGFGNLGGYFFGGGAGNFFGGGSSGGGSFAGGGAAQLGGFIGLLQSRQQIHNGEQQLEMQLRALGLLEAHLKAGTIDLTQVDQFRQKVETQKALLLQAHNGMANWLESYKISILGLPPDLPVELDDSLIHQFQFISPDMSKLQNEFGTFLADFGEEPAEPKTEALQQRFRQLADLGSQVDRQASVVNDDLKSIEEHSDERQEALTPVERTAFAKDIRDLQHSLKELRGRVRQAESKIGQLQGQLGPTTRRQTADRLVQLVTDVAGATDEISLVQARARVERISIKRETLDPDEAFSIARANRLDWMNNRAALVDTWRLIQYNANSLRAGMNLVFSGDMSTVGNNPAQFRGTTGSLRVGLQFDAPLTRLVERNNYRQAIIDYQQERRQLIRFEDNIQETLRQLLRNLELDKVNLEIQRRAVIIAIRRVDETREVLNQPPPPPQPGQTAGQLGPTSALNLMTSLDDLRASQDALASVWLDYYATRMRLARELGVMKLDDCGMWIDEPLSTASRLKAEEVPLPPALPNGWFEQIEQIPTPPAERQTEPPLPRKSPKKAAYWSSEK